MKNEDDYKGFNQIKEEDLKFEWRTREDSNL